MSTNLLRDPISPGKPKKPIPMIDDEKEKTVEEIWDEEAMKLAESKRPAPKTSTIGIRG